MEARVPPEELELYFTTLTAAAEDLLELHAGQVRFTALLSDQEWAGPGYALAALFDPYILSANLRPTVIHLNVPTPHPGRIDRARKAVGPQRSHNVGRQLQPPAGALFADALRRRRVLPAWSAAQICWDDCVALEHVKPAGAQVIRTVGDWSEPTRLERFHSLDFLELVTPDRRLRLRHGGNIFVRQDERVVANRLWCYGEFCDRFWWAVSLA